MKNPRTLCENRIYRLIPTLSIYIHLYLLTSAFVSLITILSARSWLDLITILAFLGLHLWPVVKFDSIRYVICWWHINAQYQRVHSIPKSKDRLNNELSNLSNRQQSSVKESKTKDKIKQTKEPIVQEKNSQKQSQIKRTSQQKMLGQKEPKEAVVYYEAGQDYSQTESNNFLNKDQTNLSKGFPLEQLGTVKPKKLLDYSVSGISGAPSFKTHISKTTSMITYNDAYNQGLFQGEKHPDLAADYNLFKQKTLQHLKMTINTFQSKLKILKKNFLQFINRNMLNQIINLNNIREELENFFEISITQTQQELSPSSEKQSENQIPYYIKPISIFDAVELCLNTFVKKNSKQGLLVLWNIKREVTPAQKAKFLIAIQTLLQERIELDRFLTTRRTFIDSSESRKSALINFRHSFDVLSEGYHQKKIKLGRKTSSQRTDISILLYNFLAVTTEQILKTPQHRYLLPKFNQPLYNNDDFIQFKLKQNSKYLHFNIVHTKKQPALSVETYYCIPAKDNFWCALYSYFYVLAKKYETQLNECEGLRRLATAMWKNS